MTTLSITKTLKKIGQVLPALTGFFFAAVLSGAPQQAQAFSQTRNWILEKTECADAGVRFVDVGFGMNRGAFTTLEIIKNQLSSGAVRGFYRVVTQDRGNGVCNFRFAGDYSMKVDSKDRAMVMMKPLPNSTRGNSRIETECANLSNKFTAEFTTLILKDQLVLTGLDEGGRCGVPGVDVIRMTFRPLGPAQN